MPATMRSKRGFASSCSPRWRRMKLHYGLLCASPTLCLSVEVPRPRPGAAQLPAVWKTPLSTANSSLPAFGKPSMSKASPIFARTSGQRSMSNFRFAHVARPCGAGAESISRSTPPLCFLAAAAACGFRNVGQHHSTENKPLRTSRRDGEGGGESPLYPSDMASDSASAGEKQLHKTRDM